MLQYCIAVCQCTNPLFAFGAGEPSPGPVEASGKVHLGDYLMRIGQVKVHDLGAGDDDIDGKGAHMQAVVQQLRDSKRPLMLGFMTREAREELG
jgi:hypothetical protein